MHPPVWTRTMAARQYTEPCSCIGVTLFSLSVFGLLLIILGGLGRDIENESVAKAGLVVMVVGLVVYTLSVTAGMIGAVRLLGPWGPRSEIYRDEESPCESSYPRGGISYYGLRQKVNPVTDGAPEIIVRK